jgi:hypothetical protein
MAVCALLCQVCPGWTWPSFMQLPGLRTSKARDAQSQFPPADGQATEVTAVRVALALPRPCKRRRQARVRSSPQARLAKCSPSSRHRVRRNAGGTREQWRRCDPGEATAAGLGRHALFDTSALDLVSCSVDAIMPFAGICCSQVRGRAELFFNGNHGVMQRGRRVLNLAIIR